MTAKQEIMEIIDQCPSDASFDDINEKIQIAAALKRKQLEEMFHEKAFLPTASERAEIMAAIKRAEVDSAAGNVKSHEEVGELLRSWANKCNSK